MLPLQLLSKQRKLRHDEGGSSKPSRSFAPRIVRRCHFARQVSVVALAHGHRRPAAHPLRPLVVEITHVGQRDRAAAHAREANRLVVAIVPTDPQRGEAGQPRGRRIVDR